MGSHAQCILPCVCTHGKAFPCLEGAVCRFGLTSLTDIHSRRLLVQVLHKDGQRWLSVLARTWTFHAFHEQTVYRSVHLVSNKVSWAWEDTKRDWTHQLRYIHSASLSSLIRLPSAQLRSDTVVSRPLVWASVLLTVLRPKITFTSSLLQRHFC